MSQRETSEKIDDAAARWAARVDREPLSAGERAALDAWLTADLRHAGAYARARAVVARMMRAQALGVDFDPEQFAERQGHASPTRRRALQIGGAAAAALVAAVVGREVMRGSRIYTTRVGETRVVPLEDGSVITLNTATSVTVNYSEERRDVHLLRGEALFDVAKDPSRPFVVAANETVVRAVGTSFSVRLLPERTVRVLVREGVVELKRSQAPATEPVRIAANTRAEAPANAPIAAEPVAAREVSRELVWQMGRVAFEGETLKEAAEIFARYSETRILIDEPSLASETITGLFVSNDPIGFSKAVAVSLNLRVEVGEAEVHLRR